MSLILYLLLAALSGLVIGALARLALPGKDPMTLPQTILVGVAGTLLAGLVTYYVFDQDRGPGFLLSLLFAVLIVFAVRKWRERSAAEAPPTAGTGGHPRQVFVFWKRSGERTQVRFMPGCLIWSIILSIALTVLLNLLIRAF